MSQAARGPSASSSSTPRQQLPIPIEPAKLRGFLSQASCRDARHLVKNLFRHRRYESAVTVLTDIIQREGAAIGDDYYDRGVCQHILEDYESAEGDLRTALSMNPTSVPYLVNLANCLCQMNRHEEAIPYFDQVLTLAPDVSTEVNTLRARALCHDVAGRFEDAVSDYSVALGIDPSNGILLRGRAAIFAKRRSFNRALSDYSAAVRLDPSFSSFYHRAIVHHCLGRFHDSIHDNTYALSLLPSDANAYCNRALAYLHLKRHPNAITDFSRALSLDTQHYTSLWRLGVVHLASQHRVQSIEMMTRALDRSFSLQNQQRRNPLNQSSSSSPSSSVVDESKMPHSKAPTRHLYVVRGVAFEELRHYDLAVEDYSRALELDPTLTDALYSRGVSYCRSNRPIEAIQDFSEGIRSLQQAKQSSSSSSLNNNGRFGRMWIGRGWARLCNEQFDENVMDDITTGLNSTSVSTTNVVTTSSSSSSSSPLDLSSSSSGNTTAKLSDRTKSRAFWCLGLLDLTLPRGDGFSTSKCMMSSYALSKTFADLSEDMRVHPHILRAFDEFSKKWCARLLDEKRRRSLKRQQKMEAEWRKEMGVAMRLREAVQSLVNPVEFLDVPG